MPTGLKRYQETGELHFVTFSCVRHRPILGSAEARDHLLGLLEGTRVRYGMGVHGYVVMPEHVHLLVAEPEKAALSLAVQILKQRFRGRERRSMSGSRATTTSMSGRGGGSSCGTCIGIR